MPIRAIAIVPSERYSHAPGGCAPRAAIANAASSWPRVGPKTRQSIATTPHTASAAASKRRSVSQGIATDL
jgi:hypothetical protein